MHHHPVQTAAFSYWRNSDVSEPEDKSRHTRTQPRQEASGSKGVGEIDLAAALKYKPGGGTAPRIVAKGKGEVARKIIELAEASGIPIRKDADLAGLLSAIELDDEIPLEAFAAVAEILGFIYRANRAAPSPDTERQEPSEDQQ